jgi:hypothetical protein
VTLLAGRQWLSPVILATQKAEIRRIAVQSQPEQKKLQDLISKKPQKTTTKTITGKDLMEWLKW